MEGDGVWVKGLSGGERRRVGVKLDVRERIQEA